MTKPLPKTDEALVLRTDFSNDEAWNKLCEAIKHNSRSADGLPLELKIAGAPIEQDVETAVRAAAATTANIVYAGPVYGATKLELLEWADIVALPSSYRSEAQPLCLLEGALAGCYLIASRVGYISDLASDLHVYLLEDTSPAAIASAFGTLTANDVRASGAANREFAQAHYTISAFTATFAASIADFLVQPR